MDLKGKNETHVPAQHNGGYRSALAVLQAKLYLC